MNAISHDVPKCRACATVLCDENWPLYDKRRNARICHKCTLDAKREYYATNRQKIIAGKRSYYIRNKERLNEQSRLWAQRFRQNHGSCHTVLRHRLNPIPAMLTKAKRRAREHGIPFSLCQNHLSRNVVCPALGVGLEVCEGHPGRTSPSLDKIVPSLGYVTGNVCIISHAANAMKQDATPEESLAVALYSYTHTGHSVSDIHAAVDAILAKQAEYARINEAARNIDTAQHTKA